MTSQESSSAAMDSSDLDSSGSSKLASTISHLFECCICQQNLQDAHICPRCSQPFCRKCIAGWLGNQPTCPQCRELLTVESLVKARTFDQVQEVVSDFVASEQRNRCLGHGKDLSLFCLVCESCLCPGCMFAEEHVGHKDQVLLLEGAFEEFRCRFREYFELLKQREETLEMSLSTVKKNERLLKEAQGRMSSIARKMIDSITGHYNEEITRQSRIKEQLQVQEGKVAVLRSLANSLNTNVTTVAAMNEVTEFQKLAGELLKEKPPAVTVVDVHFKNSLIPSPIGLELYLKNARRHHRFYESSQQTESGFRWKVKVSAHQETTAWSCSLLLEKGRPDTFWVALGGSPAKPYRFELGQWVDFGDDIPCVYDSEADTLEVQLEIQQARTYAAQCSQQQDYIAELEARIGRYEAVIGDIQRKAACSLDGAGAAMEQ
uniref:E3 ubiquitin-protein ligase TRIM37 n=1 Tax=Culex pipiens TaxID=7175 RepID=A0A8D8IB07_CULPI